MVFKIPPTGLGIKLIGDFEFGTRLGLRLRSVLSDVINLPGLFVVNIMLQTTRMAGSLSHKILSKISSILYLKMSSEDRVGAPRLQLCKWYSCTSFQDVHIYIYIYI